jgi:hypothetical protein
MFDVKERSSVEEFRSERVEAIRQGARTIVVSERLNPSTLEPVL